MKYNVTDSSLYWDSYSMASSNKIDTTIHIGMVREVYKGLLDQTVYAVEVNLSGRVTIVNCTAMVTSGSPYNFEEIKYRPYRTAGINPPLDPLPYSEYKTRSGDIVLVAFIEGTSRDGVILGGLLHPSRKPEILPADVEYLKVFNGVENKITKTGKYTITFKGKLLNPLDIHVPGTPIPPAQYDPVSGGSFFAMGDDGSIELNDSVSQSFKIDKAGKKTIITSGQTIIELGAQACAIQAPKITTESKLATEMKASQFSIESQSSIKIKGMKVAIGNSTFELIDGLIKLVDALGALTAMSPNGPCNPLKNTPTWAQVEMIKTQLKSIKGSL